MPLVEPRSAIDQPCSSRCSSACRRDTFGVGDHHVAVTAAAQYGAVATEHAATALADDQRPPPCGDAALRLQQPRAAVGRVDHRVTEVAGRRRRRGALRLLVLGRRQQLRLDPELAELQPIVGVKFDLRPARERQALLARVLEQVVRQLLAQRRFVARELLAVGLREEHAVVVRHVHARDGGHLVLLHLLRQLVGELDRLDVGLEGTPERPLDEAADLRLQIAQHAHLGIAG